MWLVTPPQITPNPITMYVHVCLHKILGRNSATHQWLLQWHFPPASRDIAAASPPRSPSGGSRSSPAGRISVCSALWRQPPVSDGRTSWQISYPGPATDHILKPLTLVYKLVMRFIQKVQNLMQYLGGNWTHDHHNSSVTALPVELPSPWEQSGGELGIVYTSALGAYSKVNSSRPS